MLANLLTSVYLRYFKVIRMRQRAEIGLIIIENDARIPL